MMGVISQSSSTEDEKSPGSDAAGDGWAVEQEACGALIRQAATSEVNNMCHTV
jgi:hypothetical protein